MNNEITYHLYTIAQLRDFLLHNVSNGITLDMISTAGGYALINNPCAKDEDVVLSVAKLNGEVVGYTAVFGEDLVRPSMRLFWGSSEWVDARLRGKGIGAHMMRNIKDAVRDVYFGLESSPASIKLDLKQGSKVCYYNKYQYKFSSEIHGLKAKLKSAYIHHHNAHIIQSLEKHAFEVKYINFIDDETYDFIKQHSSTDLFLRKQEMLNWMLTYPYQNSTYGDERAVSNICEYWPDADRYRWIAAEILQNGERVGVALFTKRNSTLTIRYIYFDSAHEKEVYCAILHVIFKICTKYLYHCSQSFAEYLLQVGIKQMNSKSTCTQISFTYPPDFEFNPNLHIQGGDGDMFC